MPSGELPLPFPAVLELNIPVATLLQELLRGLRAITEAGDFESLLPCERPGQCKSSFLCIPRLGEGIHQPRVRDVGKDGEIVKSAYNHDNGCGTHQSMQNLPLC